MDRQVVHHGADTQRLQLGHDLRPRLPDAGKIDQHGIKVQGGVVAGLRRHDPELRREVWQQLVVESGEFAAALDETPQLGELAFAERAGEIGDAVVPAQRLHFVIPGVRLAIRAEAQIAVPEVRRIAHHAVTAIELHDLVMLRVVGGGDTTLACRHRLDRMKREAGEFGERAGADPGCAAVARLMDPAQRMAGILDHLDAARLGDGADGGEVGAMAVEMHRQDRLHPG